MNWKRRYTAEIPDPDFWSLVDHRDGWLLYRAHELLDGWRNYRLIHRRPAKTRVSFRLGWSPSLRCFSRGRDHVYLATHNREELIYWVKDIASNEPDELSLDTDIAAGEKTT